MTRDCIAVVGMAGRFPGARNLDELWRNLCAGADTITRFDREALIAEGVGRELVDDPGYVAANGVLDEVDRFDATFFGMTPRDAALTDPQHRVFLECAWSALEDAGCDPHRFDGPIAVYAGAGPSTYLLHHLWARQDVLRSAGEMQVLLANHADYLATRVSYKLDLRGPSLSVGTACSTSLVAIQLACQGLLDYRCDAALAGGISIQLPQRRGYLYTPGGVLSPDGRCRAFDAAAQGTVSGNGVGVVVLKRLETALRDGDSIRALVLGGGINNDGAAKAGYTAPGSRGQAAVIAQAHADADVSPDTIGYVEAHGTGTVVGDPLEIAALAEAFRRGTAQTGFCAIGSVKSNIGHLDEAAGVAGFIKTVLMLQHRMLPPTLHVDRPNPAIDFASSPFVVNTELRRWPAPTAGPRRAGVSSFGIGGTNVHLVLEEAPASASSTSRGAEVLVWSAKTAEALTHTAVALADQLEAQRRAGAAISLGDVAHTLQAGRTAFDHRRAIACRGVDEAIDALRACVRRSDAPAKAATAPSVVFLCSGQGGQHVGMGRELYETEPVFRDAFDRCATRLTAPLGHDLRSLVYPAVDADPQAASEQLADTAVAQPALFAVEYAAAELLRSLGVTPRAIAGHSLGEYVAAHLAGVWTLDEALAVVATRGRLMRSTEPGAMVSIGAPASAITGRLGADMSLAAVNAPDLCVASGPAAAIAILVRDLERAGIECRPLDVTRAFHSASMDPVMGPLVEAIAATERRAPTLAYLSNVTGTWIEADDVRDSAYWGRHLRQTVRFADNLAAALQLPDPILVEIGPGRALTSAARRLGASAFALLPHAREAGAVPPLARLVGELWTRGVAVDWEAVRHGEPRRRVPLPTYPFERQRHWVDPPPADDAARASGQDAAGLDAASHGQKPVADWFYLPSWTRSLPPAAAPVSPQTWLVLTRPGGPAVALARALERAGHAVTLCEDEPGAPLADRVLDARAWDDPPEPAPSAWVASLSAHAAEARIDACLRLARRLSAPGTTRATTLIVLTRGAHDVTGQESLAPDVAALTGALLVVQQELPELRCRMVDVAADTPIALLAAEVERDRPEAPIVAWRGPHRWVRAYEPVRLEALDRRAADRTARPAWLRDRGVYLVTGGLGGVGLIVAEYLARIAQARLVLLGRTPIADAAPPEGDPNARLRDAERGWAAGALRTLTDRPGLAAAVRRLCAAYARDYFDACGVPRDRLATLLPAELTAGVGARPAFARFVTHLRSLALEHDGREPAAAQRDAAIDAHPDLAGMIRLLDHCAAHYRRALSGEIPAIGVLYPDGRADLLEQAGGAAAADDSGELCRRLIEAEVIGLARRATAAKPLRILEVGAGDGLLTRRLAPALKGLPVDYLVTDLGRGFVRELEDAAAAAGLDYVRVATLDISRDPVAQGFDAGSFDVVLGLDVVHATPDIVRTLGFLQTLLDAGGLLALVETVTRLPWIDLIWGLAEGWWSFTDDDRLRAGSPLLDVAGWTAALAQAGFEAIASFPSNRPDPDQALIVGRRRRSTDARSAAIARLERLGAAVDVVIADVADRDRMQAVLAGIRARHGALHGVIHAAGDTSREAIVNLVGQTGREQIDAVFRGRVQGACVLAELLDDAPLDICALISSNASTLGGLGLSAYAAASSALDAIAGLQRSRRGRPWISTNWDGWPTEEATGRDSGFQTGIDRFAMRRADAEEALARALEQPVGQIVVSSGALEARLDRWTRRTGDEPVAAAAAAPPPSASFHTRPALETPWAAPRTATERTIAAIWEELLGIERLGVEDNFFDLDGDSLLGTRLIGRIGRECGVTLPFRALFEQPTIAGLAAAVDRARGGPPSVVDRQPIPKAPDAASYPVSHAQRRLWVLSQIDTTGAAYNVPLHQIVDGDLDPRALDRALTLVLERHESLRTVFRVIDGELRQVVLPAPPYPIVWQDLVSGASTGAGPAADVPARAAAIAARHAAEPFDLAAGPLIRVAVLTLAERCHVLLCTLHHIICDGVSIGLLTRDLAQAYDVARGVTASGQAALAIQYRDYAVWRLGQVADSAASDADGQYWRRQLAAPLPVLNLPLDHPRPAAQTFRGRERLFTVDGAQVDALRALGRDQQASLFMVLVALVQTLLHRHTQQHDIIVGSPIAGRGHPDLDEQIGHYLNMLALRSHVRGDQPFDGLLRQVRDTAAEAYDHQDYPFDRLVDELPLERDLARSPVFDVVVILQNQAEPPLRFGDAVTRPFFDHSGTSKYDLTFSFKDVGDRLLCGLEYNTDLFAADRIERLSAHFVALASAVIATPAAAIATLPLISAAERQLVLADYAAPQRALAAGAAASVAGSARGTAERAAHCTTVIDLFERQAVATPSAVAASDDSGSVTYTELRDRVRRLARALRGRGVTRGARVGLAAGRSIELLVAALGVLKAGAAYVPLDPTFPEERLAFMRSDAGLACVLADADVLALERLAPGPGAPDATTDPIAADLAYVLYTSGSTGRPKGVMIPHGALANLLLSMAREPGLGRDDVLLAVTTMSFDIAGLELFLPLICGARVAIASSADAADGARLVERLRDTRATVMQATPVTWRMLLDAGWRGAPTLRVWCGGEALPTDLACRLDASCGRVWNLYGPTETTIWSAAFDVSAALAPADGGGPARRGPVMPIGHAIAETQLAVCDAGGDPMPLGVPGELHIGGSGVADGYLHRPDLTAERFVPDPFSARPGARRYRTGDLASRRADGVVDFLGRLDDQIKLRGFRIEIGDIESALAQCPLVSRAAVVLQREADTGGDARLLAAIVPRPDAAHDPDELAGAIRAHLRDRVPPYMVPDTVAVLADLPRTPNQKIDRKALRALRPARPSGRSFVAPRTPFEAAIAAIWAEVLEIEAVSVDAGFFALGGQSLKALRVASRIQRELGVTLGLLEFFEHATVEEQAALVAARGAATGGAASVASIPVAPLTADELAELSE